MTFQITILGANSAIPTSTKFTTSQVLNYNHNYFLIDCGEGTQMQLRANKVKLQSINHIFISHLHGDHFFGLIGLLSTMSLMGRTKELKLFAPAELKDIVNIQLKASGTWLAYTLTFIELNFDEPQILLELKGLQVSSFPVQHKINCCGFLFKELPKPRKINKFMVGEYKVPIAWMQKLTEGKNYTTEEGNVILNSKLTLNPPESKSYAYCADTQYFEELSNYVSGVDLLYHEATFAEDLIERAKKTKHSTAKQAGTVAKHANVKKLIIGHFSARYTNTEMLLVEAVSEFSNTEIAKQNNTYRI